MNQKLKPESSITFLYYKDLTRAESFYTKTMNFELVEDQKWAKIFRIRGNAFVGIVREGKGFAQPPSSDERSVLLTIVVRDVDRWYSYLTDKGVKVIRDIQDREDINIRCFFIEDPGGYALEIQQFMDPDVFEIFEE